MLGTGGTKEVKDTSIMWWFAGSRPPSPPSAICLLPQLSRRVSLQGGSERRRLRESSPLDSSPSQDLSVHRPLREHGRWGSPLWSVRPFKQPPLHTARPPELIRRERRTALCGTRFVSPLLLDPFPSVLVPTARRQELTSGKP